MSNAESAQSVVYPRENGQSGVKNRYGQERMRDGQSPSTLFIADFHTLDLVC